MDQKYIILLVVAVALAAYYFFYMKPKSKSPMADSAPAQSGDLVVYGSMGCGWTKKQLKYLDDKKMDYKFVDCDSEECPPDVKGYPTMIYNGETISGYKEL